jgi:hypothetical protein
LDYLLRTFLAYALFSVKLTTLIQVHWLSYKIPVLFVLCSFMSGDSVLKVKALFFTGILLSGLFSECLATSIAQQWATVTQPTGSASNAQSIGTYNAGCISGAVSLPINGTGYQVMRLSRNRAYGHPDLKQFIEGLGQTAARQHFGELLIGI